MSIYPDRRHEIMWWFDYEMDGVYFQEVKPFWDQQGLDEATEDLADYKRHKGRSRKMRERGGDNTLALSVAAAEKLARQKQKLAKPPEPQEPIEPGVLFNTIIQAAREAAPQGWEALAIDGEVKPTERDGRMLTEVSADFQARMPDGSLRTIHVPTPIAAMNALSHLQKSYSGKDGAPWQRIRIFYSEKNNGNVRCVFDQPGLWAGEDY
jgi:hypothetical protein